MQETNSWSHPDEHGQLIEETKPEDKKYIIKEFKYVIKQKHYSKLRCKREEFKIPGSNGIYKAIFDV